MFHYLKFLAFFLIAGLVCSAIAMGKMWTVYGAIVLHLVYFIGDVIGGDDTSTPEYRYPQLLTFMIWLALPVLAVTTFTGVWSVASTDVLGYGAWLSNTFGYDFLAAREATTWWQHGAGIWILGMMIGFVGTTPAHELTHRTWDKISLVIGRWLLAFSFDTSFSIEHVYGHHNHIATPKDPASAPRGRNVYWHIIYSTIFGNISAWKIEKRRCQRRKFFVYGLRNTVLRGHLMSLMLVLVSFFIAGWQGVLYFSLAGLWGKALLEIVNYMEHYGIVREPGAAVRPHHSWNANNRLSSWTMFNLTRHSHHHAQGEVPFQDLKPYPDAPMMIGGYLSTISIAMIPPLWFRLMAPKLKHWDEHFATDRERELLAKYAKQ